MQLHPSHLQPFGPDPEAPPFVLDTLVLDTRHCDRTIFRLEASVSADSQALQTFPLDRHVVSATFFRPRTQQPTVHHDAPSTDAAWPGALPVRPPRGYTQLTDGEPSDGELSLREERIGLDPSSMRLLPPFSTAGDPGTAAHPIPTPSRGLHTATPTNPRAPSPSPEPRSSGSHSAHCSSGLASSGLASRGCSASDLRALHPDSAALRGASTALGEAHGSGRAALPNTPIRLHPSSPPHLISSTVRSSADADGGVKPIAPYPRRPLPSLPPSLQPPSQSSVAAPHFSEDSLRNESEIAEISSISVGEGSSGGREHAAGDAAGDAAADAAGSLSSSSREALGGGLFQKRQTGAEAVPKPSPTEMAMATWDEEPDDDSEALVAAAIAAMASSMSASPRQAAAAAGAIQDSMRAQPRPTPLSAGERLLQILSTDEDGSDRDTRDGNEGAAYAAQMAAMFDAT